MTKRNSLSVILVIVFCCVAIYALQRSHKTISPKKTQPSFSKSASLEDFDFTEYSDGGANKKITIKGKRFGAANKRLGAFQVSVMRVTEIRDAAITFYENGSPVSNVIAKKAFLEAPADQKDPIASLTRRIDLSGGVDVVTTDKRTLVCDSARWDHDNNRISARGNCVLRFAGKMLKADRVDSDVKLLDFAYKNDKLKRLRALGRAVM